jgi:transcriptional regulator with XRE-family HTH domain
MKPTTARDDLELELRDDEFRKLYGAAEAKSELAIAIADARHSLGLTQEEMSSKVEVSQPYIAKLESGEANPTVGTIGSIFAILNLRLTMGIAPLLPRPSIVNDTNTFECRLTVEYELAGDANVAFLPYIATAKAAQIGEAQQGALFSNENYNSFTPLSEVGDSSLLTLIDQPFEEATIGGQRT